MPLIVMAAVASFACVNPRHHDGDAIRCDGQQRSMRLHAIDAPEMPGACRPGRVCTPGDPFRSRDYIASLTRGRNVRCEQVDTDNYGRRVVACTSDGRSLGCAMVAGGMAVERYGRLECELSTTASTAVAARSGDVSGDRIDAPSRAEQADMAVPAAAPAPNSTRFAGFMAPAAPESMSLSWNSWSIVGLWFILLNCATALCFLVDKRRAQAGRSRERFPEWLLLSLAAVGGSPGAIAAQQLLRHKTVKQPFANRLLMIAGLQLGIILALVAPVL